MLCLTLPSHTANGTWGSQLGEAQQTTVKNSELQTAEMRKVNRPNKVIQTASLKTFIPKASFPKPGVLHQRPKRVIQTQLHTTDIPSTILGSQFGEFNITSQQLISKQNVFKMWVIWSVWNLQRVSQHSYVRFLYIGAPYSMWMASLFTAADNSIRDKDHLAFPQLKYQGHFKNVHCKPTDQYHNKLPSKQLSSHYDWGASVILEHFQIFSEVSKIKPWTTARGSGSHRLTKQGGKAIQKLPSVTASHLHPLPPHLHFSGPKTGIPPVP